MVLSKNSCGSSVVQQMQRCTGLKYLIGSSAVFSQTYLIFWFNVAVCNLVYAHAMVNALTQILLNLVIILQLRSSRLGTNKFHAVLIRTTCNFSNFIKFVSLVTITAFSCIHKYFIIENFSLYNFWVLLF